MEVFSFQAGVFRKESPRNRSSFRTRAGTENPKLKTFPMPLRILFPLIWAATAVYAAQTPTGATGTRPIDDAAYDAALDDAALALRLKKHLFSAADLTKAEGVRELALALPPPGGVVKSGGELFSQTARATLILCVRAEDDAGENSPPAGPRTLAAAGRPRSALRASRRPASGGDATAFVIHESGVAVTCLHALPSDGSKFVITACTVDGRIVAVRDILLIDKENDLVFLKLDAAAEIPALPLRVDIAAGEPVRVLGHPLYRYFHLTDGIVARHSRADPEENDDGAPRPARLDLTADIVEGSSGAPVVDSRGAVVGVAQSYAVEVAEEGETVFKHRSAIPAAAILGKIKAPETAR